MQKRERVRRHMGWVKVKGERFARLMDLTSRTSSISWRDPFRLWQNERERIYDDLRDGTAIDSRWLEVLLRQRSQRGAEKFHRCAADHFHRLRHWRAGSIDDE